MNLHEYQAKEILKIYGIRVPIFRVASNVEDVEKIVKELSLQTAVLKIQVHAGGRGKGGGVKFANSSEEIVKIAKNLIGMKLINNQTGPSGITAHQILIAPPVDIEKEYYLSATIDRKSGKGVLIASPEGGMEIEEIAKKFPNKILTIPISNSGTIRPFHLRSLAKFMQWPQEIHAMGFELVTTIAKVFVEKDASLIEINPLVLTKQQELIVLDAKMAVDDNALYRQKEIAKFYDSSQESTDEVEAKKHNLTYIGLNGNIGCMVNGAGLAMATMDLIKFYGGSPANFLDVGGGADIDKIAAGFKILVSNSNVKAILVNIFGGIMDCNTIAEGLVQILQNQTISIPIIIRMEGTNVEKGKQLLLQSKLKIEIKTSLAQAAELAVASIKN
jgi:succinyl-CoA synthetase beta subunit